MRNNMLFTSLQSHLPINELLLLSLYTVFILQTFAYLNKSYRPHIKFKNKKNWQYYILGNDDAMLLLIYLVPMNFLSQRLTVLGEKKNEIKGIKSIWHIRIRRASRTYTTQVNFLFINYYLMC